MLRAGIGVLLDVVSLDEGMLSSLGYDTLSHSLLLQYMPLSSVG